MVPGKSAGPLWANCALHHLNCRRSPVSWLTAHSLLCHQHYTLYSSSTTWHNAVQPSQPVQTAFKQIHTQASCCVRVLINLQFPVKIRVCKTSEFNKHSPVIVKQTRLANTHTPISSGNPELSCSIELVMFDNSVDWMTLHSWSWLDLNQAQ